MLYSQFMYALGLSLQAGIASLVLQRRVWRVCPLFSLALLLNAFLALERYGLYLFLRPAYWSTRDLARITYVCFDILTMIAIRQCHASRRGAILAWILFMGILCLCSQAVLAESGWPAEAFLLSSLREWINTGAAIFALLLVYDEPDFHLQETPNGLQRHYPRTRSPSQ